MGHVRYVAFCLLGGLVALAAQSAVHPSSATPALAACGATAAVLGGYTVLYSRARVLTVIFVVLFATVVELPALLLLGLLFLGQLYLGARGLSLPTGAGGGLAYLAQALGGFACGAALIWAFARHRRAVPTRYPVY